MDVYTTRLATPADTDVIDKLISRAGWLLLQTWRNDAKSAWQDHDFFILEKERQEGGACGLFIGPCAIAHLGVFALSHGWPLHPSLTALLSFARHWLSGCGVTTLVYVGMDHWLVDGLLANGFCQVNVVVNLQKTDWDVPVRGNPHVAVRRAGVDDFADILAIEAVAFEPLWRNTIDALNAYLTEHTFLFVAELDNYVVGYYCVSLNGRHGHLTRLVVHPDYQGRQIGIRLLAEALVFFRGQRVFGVTLNTQQDNHRARRLYEWFGFRTLGQEARVLTWAI